MRKYYQIALQEMPVALSDFMPDIEKNKSLISYLVIAFG